MVSSNRGTFQGLTNIIRFNWHFYFLAFLMLAIVIYSRLILPPGWRQLAGVASFIGISMVLISLLASFYIYDRSGFYSLAWLNIGSNTEPKRIVNIHAGFDETSAFLANKYPDAQLMVLDFYDRQKHTEVSIERARRAYPSYPSTQKISTSQLPDNIKASDFILLIFSAHEIRDDRERIHFFKQLAAMVKDDGKIIVVEHLRDALNFLVYNVGAFHFLPLRNWTKTFKEAGLRISSRKKVNPFITQFILSRNVT